MHEHVIYAWAHNSFKSCGEISCVVMNPISVSGLVAEIHKWWFNIPQPTSECSKLILTVPLWSCSVKQHLFTHLTKNKSNFREKMLHLKKELDVWKTELQIHKRFKNIFTFLKLRKPILTTKNKLAQFKLLFLSDPLICFIFNIVDQLALTHICYC